MKENNERSGMRGEFRGDFTRDTFNPTHQFSRVLMQQGRVQIDADWNEQVSIMTHYLRSLASDLIGPHGAPADMNGKQGSGFYIKTVDEKIIIHPGPYYVCGIRCQGYEDKKEQPIAIEAKKNNYLVYLDVWERHLNYVEEDRIREVALNGPDTASRAKIEYQVKTQSIDSKNNPFKDKDYNKFLNALEEKRPGSGCLRARARRSTNQDTEPCLISPESRYRGLENQLYRVEIHKSGDKKKATFKFSRENGSVIFPITEPVIGPLISLEHLGRDSRYGLKPDDWVEIYDDAYALEEDREPLLQVEEVLHDTRQVRLTQAPGSGVGSDLAKHPYLRRWDQKLGDKNGISLAEGSGEDDWQDLEDGIQIQFLKPVKLPKQKVQQRDYFAGDYWLIPARTITGDVEWPRLAGNPEDLPAHGVVHHYAPLAFLSRKTQKDEFTEYDLRRVLVPFWK
jgi:hypothetical protein